MNLLQRKPTNVYHQGAVDGLYLGAYFTAMFLMQAIAPVGSIITLVSQLMMLAVPFIAYVMLRNGCRAVGWSTTFAATWMHGIGMFIGGSLIMALIAYVYMRFVNEGYIAGVFNTAADLYLSLPDKQAQEMGHVLRKLVETHQMPNASALAMSMMFLGSFSGSILSFVLAAILSIRKRRHSQPTN